MAILFALPVFASADDQDAVAKKAAALTPDLSKRILEEEIACFKDRVNYGLTCKEVHALFEAHKQTQAAIYLIPLAPHETLTNRLCKLFFLGAENYRFITIAQLQHFMTVPYEDPDYPCSWVFKAGPTWFQLIDDHGVTLNQQIQETPEALPPPCLDKLNQEAVVTFEKEHNFNDWIDVFGADTPYFDRFTPYLKHFMSHKILWEEGPCVWRAPLLIHTFSPQKGLDLRLLSTENMTENLTYLSRSFAGVTLHDFWMRPLEGYAPHVPAASQG